jgi:uncharacterized membrane protein YdcZ (DUF606 family)
MWRRTTLTALIVTRRLVCSVVLDQSGWIGCEVHPTSASRVAGCVLIGAAIVLISRV